MANKIFLDINIMVDFIDSSRHEHEAAKDLFDQIEQRNIQAFFSESVINTSGYLVRKVVPLLIFNKLIIRLLELIKILPCSNIIVEQAYKNGIVDLEDAVLYQVALISNMDYFISNDKKDFKKLAHSSLPVITAKELLRII